MRFIDTNVFIRCITGDDAGRTGPATDLLERVERGFEEVFTSESVVAEIIYVLTSPRQYGITRAEAAARVRPILASRGLHLDSKETVEHALEVYEAYPHLDFEDALSIAHMQSRGITEIVSYDRGFDAVPDVTRLEP